MCVPKSDEAGTFLQKQKAVFKYLCRGTKPDVQAALLAIKTQANFGK